jgi:hypothetical protein
MSGETRRYPLVLTTQGPTYPPSEVMNAEGDFVVIGRINRGAGDGCLHMHSPRDAHAYGAHGTESAWGAAIVSASSPLPRFGANAPYDIVRGLDLANLSAADRAMVLYTLPIPLPCNNYEMEFAPEQSAWLDRRPRPSYPLHAVPLPDLRVEDGRKVDAPIALGAWIEARGELTVTVPDDRRSATFSFEFEKLIPDTLYTVMSLRERDFDPRGPTRPGPLGIPNVLISDERGNARYRARLPNPFPSTDKSPRNRITNTILLWMSYQCSHGGAMGVFGLGGDVHAQLKLSAPSFFEFTTAS